MSVNEKMTALADEIRTLSGTTGTMGLDDMKTNVATANADVATEADLIAQIASALEGKVAGGGNDVPTNVTLNFSWTATSSAYAPEVLYSYINENGDYASNVYIAQNTTSGSTTLTVAKKSIICILPQYIGAMQKTGVNSYSSSDGIILLHNNFGTRHKNAFYLINNDGNLTVNIKQSNEYVGGSN